MKLPKNKIVLVEWEDATVDIEDEHDTHDSAGRLVYSVGFLGTKSKAGIALYMDYDPALQLWATRLIIPKGMVKKITTLKVDIS